MSRKKPRFRVGEQVTVRATCAFRYEKDQRATVRTECKPFAAVVVGARYRMLGEYMSERVRQHSADGFDYDPPYLNVTKAVLVWLVIRGMTNRPLEVLDEDIERANVQVSPVSLPWRYAEQPPWTEEVRRELSEGAKAMPRNARGRFCLEAEGNSK